MNISLNECLLQYLIGNQARDCGSYTHFVSELLRVSQSSFPFPHGHTGRLHFPPKTLLCGAVGLIQIHGVCAGLAHSTSCVICSSLLLPSSLATCKVSSD